MNDDEKILFGTMIMRLSYTTLVHMESWRRYAAMGKFATRNDEEVRREETRRERAWAEAAMCRQELKRREELER